MSRKSNSDWTDRKKDWTAVVAEISSNQSDDDTSQDLYLQTKGGW